MSDFNLNPTPPTPLSQDTPINKDIEIMGEEEDLDEVEPSEKEGTDSTENEEVVKDNDEIEGNEGNSTAGKTRSMVWDHFEVVNQPTGPKNKCKHCNALLSVQKGKATTHLMRHLKDSCPARNKIFPKILNPKVNSSSNLIQTQLKGLSEGDSTVSAFIFNFENTKKLAAHMVLAHEYPFNIVEHKVFNEFLKSYTPYYKKISRYMVRQECFKVYDMEKEKLKGLLKKVDRVSLTTDCWSSGVQKIGYMVITAHFIDKNWNLQKRVLSFVNVPPPHSGVVLAKEVHRVCNLFGISQKVASVTVDNASANDVCITKLKSDYDSISSNLFLDGKLFHVRCCAHIINLLVRDGLKEIGKVIEKVRDGVKYLFGSESRLISFNEHRMNLKLPPNKLVLDNNTRWNSTYVMLSIAYKYRQCFTKFGEDDENFANNYCPSESQWYEVSEVCDFLQVFLDVTNLISGSNYPTVNLFLLELSRIKELINEQLDPSKKKHMQKMAEKMALKYDKYWEECDLLLCFGTILDPRYKKVLIKFAFESMYPKDDVDKDDDDDDDDEDVDTVNDHIPIHEGKASYVFGKFKELYKQYATVYGNEKPPPSDSASCKLPPPDTIRKRKFDEFLTKTKSKGKQKSDLDLYYDEEVYPNVCKFDALTWWKANEAKYKVLSKMAKDILSIPITTVASESTFTAGGRVIDKRRASMKRETVEVLVCAGDWIKELYGIKSFKDEAQGNDDPDELEHENEYDMKDPINTADDDAAPAPPPPPVSTSSGTGRSQSKANNPRLSSAGVNPPKSKKSNQKRRKTHE